MTTIERLRALLDEATPGPWRERIGGGWLAINEPTRAYVYAIPGEPNLALIVAAVNALPALLDVVEAARSLAAVHEALHRRGDPDWQGWECDEQNALRRALDRLDGPEVGA